MAAASATDDAPDMQATTSDIRDRAARRVEVRPLAPGDRDRLAQAFSRLSEETRRRRFGGLASQLAERDLDRLTQIDHHHHEALAAIAPGTGRIVGVARFITLPDDPRAAEVAIAVDDEWQGRGIGRRLMSELVGRARAEGIARLLAYVRAENRPVLSWIARAGGVAEAYDGDETAYSIALDRPADDRRAA
jgi:ribosomal protein S18 acetylase RimI-like enzyme